MLSTHRSMTRLAGLLVGASFVFVACSGTGGGPSAGASAGSMDALVAQAKKEGNLTTIALPHTWCNYGEMLTAFSTKYGIKINELNPDGSSAAEIDAIKANKTNPGPQAPDVMDVGLSFGPQAKADGVLANYKVATWDDIPAAAKDADGAWYGDYYGVMSFETTPRSSRTPRRSCADLLKPEYKGKVALSGDPTKSNQAISPSGPRRSPTAARSTTSQPGLDFFKKLNDMGNFVPVIAKQATVASGETPIVLTWTYTALADRDKLAGNPADRGQRADRRPVRGHVRPGHQRLRAASVRGQAVGGVPVLRRGPAHLAEGLLQPDPLRRTRRGQARSRPT